MKVTELQGAALDWAVAKCEGLGEFWLQPEEFNPQYESMEYHYSTDWAQGGPIIEREKVHLFQQESINEWTASLPRGVKVGWRILQYGPTPLIAAMRCYVASKLGDEIELPEELK